MAQTKHLVNFYFEVRINPGSARYPKGQLVILEKSFEDWPYLPLVGFPTKLKPFNSDRIEEIRLIVAKEPSFRDRGRDIIWDIILKDMNTDQDQELPEISYETVVIALKSGWKIGSRSEGPLRGVRGSETA